MQGNNQSLPARTDLTNKKIQHYRANRSLSVRPDNLLHFHVLFMLREAARSRISPAQRGEAGRGRIDLGRLRAPARGPAPAATATPPLQFVFVSSF